MVDLRKLQDDALTAVTAGDWATAAGLYATLEKTAPGDGTWSLRLGECLRKLGRRDDAVKALTRALTAYLRGNARRKAVAVGKLILEIDRHNRQVQQVLELLHDPDPGETGQEATPAAPEPAAPEPATACDESGAFPVPASLLKAERGQRNQLTNTPSPPSTAPPPLAPVRPVPRVVLPRTPFLSAMQEHQLRMVNERSHLLQVAPGQILFALGEPADALYLVASGSIAVLLPQEVMRLGRGDFFGEEVAILPGQPRLTTMRAVEATQVLALDRDLVGQLVVETPALLDILAASLRERLLAKLLHTSPMLASVPLSERAPLLGRFSFATADPDDHILEPEAAGADLWVLLAGQAEACVDDWLTETLQPGDVFGEIPLVTECQFGTLVVARDKCLLLRLVAGEVERLGREHPALWSYLTALAENRVERVRHLAATALTSTDSFAVPPRALLAHRDPGAVESWAQHFAAARFIADYARDVESALRMLASGKFDVVVCDGDWLTGAGDDPLGDIRRHDLYVPIILTARTASPGLSETAASQGVVRSFVEPLDAAELVDTAVRAARFHRLTLLQREAIARLGSSGEWMGDRAGLALRFHSALDHLSMAFQPIVSASAGGVFAFEALLRSNEDLLRSPAAVLRAAERLHRVHDVGRRTRDSVAAAAAQAGDASLLFLNLHEQDLLDDHLLDPRSPLSRVAPRVVLEISDRTPLDDLRDLRKRILALRSLGYRFAIDDLGAGHAGVATLAQLEPDIAKLDISLIRGVDYDSFRQALVRSMLGACAEMGIAAICEGVETPRERDALLRLGADLMQGYLFAKPGPPFPSVDLSTLTRKR